MAQIVSSIVPTIPSRHALLRRSINSLINQTLPDDIRHQIIISYDCDLSLSEEEAFFDEFSKSRKFNSSTEILVVSRSSGLGAGVACARNRAIERSSGDFIYFLDDDDVACSNCLKVLIDLIRCSEAGIVAGNWILSNENQKMETTSLSKMNIIGNNPFHLLIDNFIPVGGYLIRRTNIISGFSTSLGSHEDWLFLLDNNAHNSLELVDEDIVDIRVSEFREGGHRNSAHDDVQRLRDYILIYSLHPCSELATHRANFLRVLGFANKLVPSVDFMLLPNGERPSLPEIVNVNSLRFLICNPNETIQSHLLSQGSFEQHIINLSVKIIQQTNPNGIILDIGSNQGSYAVNLAAQLPQSTIHCYECQLRIYMQLCANILINKIDNIVPHNIAVGKLSLFNYLTNNDIKIPCFDIYSECYSGSLSLDANVRNMRANIDGVAEPWDSSMNSQSVQMIELDSIQFGQSVSLIKIDVEGMELDVLKSGINLIKIDKPFIIFECWSLSEFAKQREKVILFIKSLGYSLLSFGDDLLAYDHSKFTENDINTFLT